MSITVLRYAVVLVASLSASNTNAQSVTAERSYLSHGVANCSPARWAFGEKLRQAPIGLANEGTGSLFVTCDFDDVPNSLGTDPLEGYSAIYVAFLNLTLEPRQASCTLANGILGAFRYSTKTTPVNPHSGAGIVSWTMEQDHEGERYWGPVLSCAIPPGTVLTYVLGNYAEYVGQ